MLGLVHTEGSILHAKESLKAILEVDSEEERDFYEGEGGSVDSMSTDEVNEDDWPQVSSSYSLVDASADLKAKYQAAMEAPVPEDPNQQKSCSILQGHLEDSTTSKCWSSVLHKKSEK